MQGVLKKGHDLIAVYLKRITNYKPDPTPSIVSIFFFSLEVRLEGDVVGRDYNTIA